MPAPRRANRCSSRSSKTIPISTPLFRSAVNVLRQAGIPMMAREIADALIADDPEHHDYELYLAVEDIDHTRTKTKSPQTNGICERFHRTVLDEFYRVAFRKKIYWTIDELQSDLDVWVTAYNETRPHKGRWCYGKTPMQTFLDALPIAREKLLPAA